MNQNLDNMDSNFDELSKYTEPGVFRVEFVKENRAFFKEVPNVWYGAGKFIYDLHHGKCENDSLLKDYQKHGGDDFKYDFVVFGPEYADSEKLKQALEKAKSEWSGPLY